MKKLVSILIFATGCGLALASPPENYPPSRYIDLYRNSPFTDPPPPPEKVDVINEIADWTMVGLRKSVDSVIVTLLNTKNRNERIQIPSEEASEMGFAIREVKYERNFLQSEVILQKGPHTGKVTFDPKFLVLKAMGGPSTQKGNPTNVAANGTNTRGAVPTPPPAGVPPVPGSTPAGTNAPGKVPVPTAASATNNTSTKSTDRPKTTGRTRYVPRPKK